MEYWGALVPYEIGGYSELTPVVKDAQIPSSVASVAQVVAARAYTDTQVATEVTRANGAYAAQGIFTGAPMALPFGWNFLGFEVWTGATPYNPGDALTYNSTLYVSIAPHSGVPPDSNPAIWTLIPTFFDLAGAAAAKADAALAASSNNTNAVATLDTPFANDPPALADMEFMRAKVNDMLLAMRR